MNTSQLLPDVVIWGDVFPERVKIIRVDPLGKSVRLFAVGCNTRNSYSPILNEEQINSLECSDITKEY
ncbi:MAG: hypothetical protein LBP59_04735, partial [Planctomycetaceae bacterium]|nr:hypothetical protein [Planctomycetaceae bacterium]